ncbi:MAG: hypothetical protein IJI01_06365 [Butyrivibrio sp.]|uniref:hypothetical protein n=1 Tax=Butyrivibrio sp. TaxID=28121 RepID=UPI0025BA7350|nr:hypothetical protein [Butyrivibrio sp.]MBQ6588284.1 hypothetical protein [Butyrivibrio sp.]
MMTIMFLIFFFMIFGKLAGFAFRATWGIMKMMFYFIFLPFIIVGLVMGGLLYIAFPILLVVGLFSLLKTA